MLRTGHYLKVFWAVIETIMVNVVNYFSRKERAAYYGLGYQLMLTSATAIAIANPVSGPINSSGSRYGLSHLWRPVLKKSLVVIAAIALGVMNIVAAFKVARSALSGVFSNLANVAARRQLLVVLRAVSTRLMFEIAARGGASWKLSRLQSGVWIHPVYRTS